MASVETLTPGRRGIAAALLFLGSAALAGVTLPYGGVEYRVFGLTEGLLALLLCYILLLRRVWLRPPGVAGWLAVGYGTLATAQLLELLLPPAGIIEWIVVTGLALTAWAALSGGTRQRMLGSLASLSLLLALFKFSVIPFVWERAGPAPGAALGLGNVAESFRRLFVDYQPLRQEGQLVGFLAIVLWALGTRLLWPAGVEEEEWREVLPKIRRLLEE
ncbi:MAG: hypothetical protein H0W11_00380 [Gemmatimonadetes bacterium]|nr:hypothetical protein [Gemmatimonadota bacterium]